jgi:hypothetical protein
LPHSRLAVVFWASVDTERDQISPVYTLLLQALFSLLCPEDPILLQLTGFPLSLGLAPWFEGGVALGILGCPDAQE